MRIFSVSLDRGNEILVDYVDLLRILNGEPTDERSITHGDVKLPFIELQSYDIDGDSKFIYINIDHIIKIEEYDKELNDEDHMVTPDKPYSVVAPVTNSFPIGVSIKKDGRIKP